MIARRSIEHHYHYRRRSTVGDGVHNLRFLETACFKCRQPAGSLAPSAARESEQQYPDEIQVISCALAEEMLAVALAALPSISPRIAGARTTGWWTSKFAPDVWLKPRRDG